MCIKNKAKQTCTRQACSAGRWIGSKGVLCEQLQSFSHAGNPHQIVLSDHNKTYPHQNKQTRKHQNKSTPDSMLGPHKNK